MFALKSENLDQTSYYKVGEAVGLPISWGGSAALRGRFALSVVSSLAAAVALYAVAVFKPKIGSHESVMMKQGAKIQLYSARKSFQAIWSLEGCLKAHLFVVKDLFSKVKEDKITPPLNFSRHSQPMKKMLLNWVDKKVHTKRSPTFRKFVIESLLSMGENDQLGQDLAQQRNRVITAMTDVDYSGSSQVLFFCEGSKRVDLLRYFWVKEYIQDFPQLTSNGRIKFYISESERAVYNVFCSN